MEAKTGNKKTDKHITVVTVKYIKFVKVGGSKKSFKLISWCEPGSVPAPVAPGVESGVATGPSDRPPLPGHV